MAVELLGYRNRVDRETAFRGMVTNVPPRTLADGESPYCRNMVLRNKALTTRPGIRDISATTLDSALVGLWEWTCIDGTHWLLGATLEHLWKWDDTEENWAEEPLTPQLEVSSCETAWATQAHVTCAMDTENFKFGIKSAKHTTDADFTGGLIATLDFTAADVSTYTAVGVWLRASEDVTAGDLQLVLSETAACGVEDVVLDMPALVADTWTYALVDADLSAINALISIGLKSADTLASTVFLVDDVRVFKKLTAGLDNYYSATPYAELFVLTNGTTDGVLKWDGTTRGFELLAGASGYNSVQAFHHARIVLEAKGHLILVNVTEDSVEFLRRIRWSGAGTPEEWPVTGYLDIFGTEDEILAAVPWLNRVVAASLSTFSIIDYTGGDSPFAAPLAAYVRGDVCYAQRSMIACKAGVFYLGRHNVYRFTGELAPEKIGAPIADNLFTELNAEHIGRSFAFLDEKRDQYVLCVPGGTSTTPSTVWFFNYVDGTWTSGDMAACSASTYRRTSAITIGDLSLAIGAYGLTRIRDWAPTIGGAILVVGDATGRLGEYDENISSDFGTDVAVERQSRDFDGGNESWKRFQRATIESAGAAMSISHSLDGGLSWSPEVEYDATTDWTQSDYWLDVAALRIRFRIRASGTLSLRRFAVLWKVERGDLVE